MCRSCEIHIEGVWKSLSAEQEFYTPDNAKSVRFFVASKTVDKIKIHPQNIYVHKESFVETLHFLKKNRHDRLNPIEIRSSADPTTAGPLCITARSFNNGVRCINYVLPILFKNNIVGIDGNPPNKTWIVRCDDAGT